MVFNHPDPNSPAGCSRRKITYCLSHRLGYQSPTVIHPSEEHVASASCNSAVKPDVNVTPPLLPLSSPLFDQTPPSSSSPESKTNLHVVKWSMWNKNAISNYQRQHPLFSCHKSLVSSLTSCQHLIPRGWTTIHIFPAVNQSRFTW